jgi:hypothetical protein
MTVAVNQPRGSQPSGGVDYAGSFRLRDISPYRLNLPVICQNAAVFYVVPGHCFDHRVLNKEHKDLRRIICSGYSLIVAFLAQ